MIGCHGNEPLGQRSPSTEYALRFVWKIENFDMVLKNFPERMAVNNKAALVLK